MSVAAPLFAWIAAAAALVAVALHLLAWRRPPETPLPTARFAPEEPLRTVSRAFRPADLALLALRVVLLLCVGFGLAGLRVTTARKGRARVIIVDQSLDSATRGVVAQSARPVFRPGDALVVFDSVAREVTAPAVDSIVAATGSGEPGELSAGLIAGVRAARRLARAHDSVELVIVSAFAQGELDAAASAIRRLWPGQVRTVRAAVKPNDPPRAGLPVVRGFADDPVAASLSLAGPVPGGSGVRVVRGAMTADDSAWARAGHTLVVWPASPGGTVLRGRSTADTVLAVTALSGHLESARGAATVVAPLARAMSPPPGRVVARWLDGEPAATELPLGRGCVRGVAVSVPEAGDLSLTVAFRRFATRMAEPCASAQPWSPVSDSVLAAVLPATVAPDSVSRAASAVEETLVAPLTPWLLAAALLAALAEPFVRRGGGNASA